MGENDRTQTGENESPHLGEDVFERLMVGELTAFERPGVLRHLEGCAECSRIHDALAELETGARMFDPGVPAAGAAARTRPGRTAWIGLAAAAALSVAVLLPWRSWLSTPVEEPGDTVRATERHDGPVLAAPLGRVEAASRLVWQPVAGARWCRAELFDADAEPLWKSPPTEESAVAWPVAVPSPPGHYYWRVVCALDRGAESVASTLERFELTPSRR